MDEPQRVLIVGAGPTGLVCALGLARQGIPVTVVEAEAALTRDMRAGSFHPPTLEMLDPLGITPRMLALGLKVPRWQIRDRRAGVVGEFDLGLIAAETPYPFRLHLEQYRLTPIALELLKAFPHAEVRFATSFISATQDEGGVTATLETADGEQPVRAAWLIGADGARSAVRRTMGVEFEGFTWPERFLVLGTGFDFGPLGYTPNAYIADPEEWVAIFKMPHDGPPGLWRVAVPIDAAMPEEQARTDAFVQSRLTGFLPGARRYDVPHCGIYRVHQRVAREFRVGRMLLAGDAAHVNNPLGAMGLNGSLHDAANLVEKLGRVWRGEHDATLLDRYVRQRRQANIEFVQALSIRNKRLLEERDPAVRARRLDEVRRTAADPALARAFLLNTSMIASVRRAQAID